MPRLVINPGSPVSWEVQLKPGTNSVGRGFANDLKIDDPSVSTSHCLIVVDSHQILIKDLGSTNGTFVNRAPIQETTLLAGQTIHLGSVEMLFQTDAPTYAAIRETEVIPSPPMARAINPTVSSSVTTGSGNCKFHPRTPGRLLCNKCHHFFCELCVASRQVGGVQHKFCRHCGTECVPVEVQLARPAAEKTFFARLPGAFHYPFKGSGILVLVAGTILFAALHWLAPPTHFGFIPRFFGWGLVFQVFATGYLFAFMQSIIHAAAIGEEEMPALPSASSFLEDILVPCLQLLGLTAVCFGPALGIAWYSISNEESSLGPALIAAFALGCLYFPMAFLSVAMLDSVLAANPLQVIPSIIKVPLEYLVATLLLAFVLGLRPLGDELLPRIFPKGLTTHSMAELFAYLGAQAFWALFSLYLLTVGMRILGLLYLTKKEKLGWLEK